MAEQNPSQSENNMQTLAERMKAAAANAGQQQEITSTTPVEPAVTPHGHDPLTHEFKRDMLDAPIIPTIRSDYPPTEESLKQRFPTLPEGPKPDLSIMPPSERTTSDDRRPLHKRPGVIFGATLALAGAVAGGIFGLSRGGGSSPEGAPQSPAAVSHPNTAGNQPSVSTSPKVESSTSPRVLNPSDIIVKNQAPAPGVIDLSKPVVGPHGTLDFTWNNETVNIPKLLSPNQYNDNQVAASVLNVLAELVSTEQTAGSQGIFYFTDSASLREAVTTMNTLFRQDDKNPANYSDQLEFYDTAVDPVSFQADGVDPQGNPVIRLASGTLYLQRVTGGEWQDNSPRDPNKALAIQSSGQNSGLWFSYKLSPDGSYIQIENLSLNPGLESLPKN